ncbi:vesicular glutamate transporter 3-like isoform X2 [Hetaerina americana]|uniref:vesicular glutamate transporter 3-like isoform X2 n=1 Tax=Hetaerina americana TaxID=62018 RepID=UPI003A7F378D
MAAGFLLTALLAIAFALAGLIQYQITAAVIKFSAAEYTDYVSKAGFVTRFCKDYDVSDEAKVDSLEDHGSGDGSDPAEEGSEEEGRHYYPVIRVPLTEDRRWELNLYEAFVWGSLVGPLIGGFLVPRLGPKRVIEGGLLGASAATLLVPAAWFTASHYALSVTQGVCTSMIWPAAHVLAYRWYSQVERTTVISFYAAWTAGWAVAVLIAGPIADSLGRDAVFYFTSLAVVCWYIAWQRYVPDSAPIPPNISWTERSLINTASDEPTSADGVLSYLPFLGHLLCAVLLGKLADHYRAHLVSTTTVRKILVYISHFLPGAIIFVIGYTGCDPSTPAALFVASLGLTGAMAAGVYTSALEISPRYCSAVLGFVQSIGAWGALASTYVIREGLYGSLPGTWTLVFGLCFMVMVVSAGIFLIFGSGTEQQWNEPEAPIVTLLTFEQANSNDLNNQQHELHQSNQNLEVIEQMNRKNQVFTT